MSYSYTRSSTPTTTPSAQAQTYTSLVEQPGGNAFAIEQMNALASGSSSTAIESGAATSDLTSLPAAANDASFGSEFLSGLYTGMSNMSFGATLETDTDTCSHEVIDGDYLIALSEEYGIPLETLKEQNGHLERSEINDNRDTLPYDFIVPGDQVLLNPAACGGESETPVSSQPDSGITGWCAPDGTCFDPGFTGDDGSGQRELEEREKRDRNVKTVLACLEGPAACSQELVNQGVDELGKDSNEDDATPWDEYWGAKKVIMNPLLSIAAGPVGWFKDALTSTDTGDASIHFDEHGRAYWIDPITGENVAIEMTRVEPGDES